MDKRYYIGPHGHRVTVENSDRANRLVAQLLDLGYEEVTEREYLHRNERVRGLQTY